MNNTFQKIYSTLTLVLIAFVYSIGQRDSSELKAIREQLEELKELAADLPAGASCPGKENSLNSHPTPAALVSSEDLPSITGTENSEPQNVKNRFPEINGLIKNQMIEMEVQELKEALSITPDQEARLREVITNNPVISLNGSASPDPSTTAERMRAREDAIIAIIGQENFDAANVQKSAKYKRIMEEEKERRIVYWQKKLELDDQQRTQFSQLLEDAETADLGDSELDSIDPAQLAKDPIKGLEYIKQRNQLKNAWIEEQAKSVLNSKQQALLKELSEKETSPFGTAGRFHSF